MKLTDDDVWWLKTHFPQMIYEPEKHQIRGDLSFGARYDGPTSKVMITLADADPEYDINGSDQFLYDAFEIEVSLDTESRCPGGWPRVRETGGRHTAIAKKLGIEEIDLHFYATGVCCLGIRTSFQRHLTIKRFLYELVIPFFYRVSYSERYGIGAARNNLWGEYSHGQQGRVEHEAEMLSIAKQSLGRNNPCACNSGLKYKHCHLDEVQENVRIRAQSLRTK